MSVRSPVAVCSARVSTRLNSADDLDMHRHWLPHQDAVAVYLAGLSWHLQCDQVEYKSTD